MFSIYVQVLGNKARLILQVSWRKEVLIWRPRRDLHRRFRQEPYTGFSDCLEKIWHEKMWKPFGGLILPHGSSVLKFDAL